MTQKYVLKCPEQSISWLSGSWNETIDKLNEITRTVKQIGSQVNPHPTRQDTWIVYTRDHKEYTLVIEKLPIEETNSDTPTKVEASVELPARDTDKQMSPLTLANQLNHVWALYHALDAETTKIKQENAMLREKLRTIADIVNH